MKLIDKVVFILFAIVFVAFIIISYGSIDESSSEKTLRVPLLKDSIAVNLHDDVYKKAIQAIENYPHAKENKMLNLKNSESKSLVSLKASGKMSSAELVVSDGLRISYTRSKLQVNIIEENEKALVYWLVMARAQHIKATDNTLILFSDQLDVGAPPYAHHFPFHRLPLNDNEMLQVLQSQGSYIMKAILTGVVNRIIWVWPKWAQIATTQTYSKHRISYGITKTSRSINFCSCESNRCKDPKGLPVSIGQCHSKMNVLVEHVEENSVYKKLLERDWLPSSDVLVHIDATFFGQVSSAFVLEKIFQDNLNLQKIDNAVRTLFCPGSIASEVYFDRLLLRAIEYSRVEKECINNSTLKFKTGPFPHCDALKQEGSRMETEIYTFLHRKLEGNQYLCLNNTLRINLLLKQLAYYFNKRNTKQLKMLKLTGFCLSTTIKRPHYFGVCRGRSNFKGAVLKPTIIDTKSKLHLIQIFLAKIQTRNIKTITFSRCIRQGRGPRFYASYIESKLLTSLKSIYPEHSLHYDSHILGSKNGWYNRFYLKETL